MESIPTKTSESNVLYQGSSLSVFELKPKCLSPINDICIEIKNKKEDIAPLKSSIITSEKKASKTITANKCLKYFAYFELTNIM